jgi:hypothetical protein
VVLVVEEDFIEFVGCCPLCLRFVRLVWEPLVPMEPIIPAIPMQQLTVEMVNFHHSMILHVELPVVRVVNEFKQTQIQPLH